MRVQVLDEERTNRIKTATEQVLEETGFIVESEEMLKLAQKRGAYVDMDQQRVKVPASLLRELLSSVPRSYTVRGVDGTAYEIGGGRQYIAAIVTDPWIIDYTSGVPRHPVLEDVKRNTVLSAANDRVAMVSLMDYPVADVTGATSELRAMETCVLNHGKHYSVYAGSLRGLDEWLALGRIAAGTQGLSGSMLMSMAVAVKSPFVLTGINTALLRTAVDHEFPVLPTVCPMAGTTGPYDKTGILLQCNAENVFLAALTQMAAPGNPVLYGIGPSVTDMRNGADLYYTMDKVLWKIAGAELARSYRMPVFSEAGGTMTHQYDMQSGAESMLFMTTAKTSGSDLLSGLGSCYNAVGLSSEMIVIQSAWLEAAEHLSKGLSVDDVERRVASIREQGPGGGFMMDELTLENLRSDEFFRHELFTYAGEGGGPTPTILESAHRRAEEIEAEFRSPVPETIQEGFRRYFQDRYRAATGG